jgi:hypothetical protein
VEKIFQVENLVTREWHEIEADSFEQACEKLGWKVEDSYFHRVNVIIPRKERLGW